MSKGFLVLILLLLIAIAAPASLFLMSSHSTVIFDPAPAAVGLATPVTVLISNPHGVRKITATVEQNGTTATLAEASEPANRMTFWRAHVPPREFHFIAGKKDAKDLREGKARLVVETQSNDLRGSTDLVSAEVNVILRPPSVTADDSQHNMNQGGSELVVFTAAGSWTEAGVRVGKNAVFRSFPLPGNPSRRFSLFAFSWDTPREAVPAVYAKNGAGTESTARFSSKVFPKKFRARNLPIDDKFLDKVVNQIDPHGSGELLGRFLKINREMRAENKKTLAGLRFKTEEKFLWTEAFLQLTNSKVESEFADVRSYIYKGKKVDQQVHLGFDLAVGQHTPVIAANDGKIVWAAPLGIYGNCIVLDHGYGLQSIYGHLSEISVKEGEIVKRGQAMGKSGSTGLAGGDHLHFSMQVDGVEVNPIEWWDKHWIHDHISSRLNPE